MNVKVQFFCYKCIYFTGELDMEITKGDLVTRTSYNNDMVFKVVNIKNGIFYLKGVEERLYADSPLEDLNIYN